MQLDLSKPVPLTKSQKDRRKRKAKREKMLAEIRDGRRMDVIETHREIVRLVNLSTREQKQAHKKYRGYHYWHVRAEDEMARSEHYRSSELISHAYRHLFDASILAKVHQWLPDRMKFERDVKDGRVFALPTDPLAIV